jgi:trans-AT polyketide synthase/acyltransferase/oxidoreductase domain-containing protein
VALALLPAMVALRQQLQAQHPLALPLRIGAAGGIGTPAAAAAAFTLGADFIVTGSINQCTVEAGISDAVKDLLQDAGVQDTDYAPAGDMFELGAKVQVLRKGLFFPARANKLYELYQRHGSLDEIDERTRRQIEEKYFRRPIEQVWAETRDYYLRSGRLTAEELERPRQKMALVFKWYFTHSARLARQGTPDQRVDYQIHCGPALGAFNAWVKDTELEPWRNRRVADIGCRIMEGAADHLNLWLRGFAQEEVS